uniref:Uncharacterized protein n=1 Tax=Timema monikensis TaxID=170555 RepID=A0A7R9E690_9NEOP|nr:unnamed protein product [Timema monikensis]
MPTSLCELTPYGQEDVIEPFEMTPWGLRENASRKRRLLEKPCRFQYVAPLRASHGRRNPHCPYLVPLRLALLRLVLCTRPTSGPLRGPRNKLYFRLVFFLFLSSVHFRLLNFGQLFVIRLFTPPQRVIQVGGIVCTNSFEHRPVGSGGSRTSSSGGSPSAPRDLLLSAASPRSPTAPSSSDNIVSSWYDTSRATLLRGLMEGGGVATSDPTELALLLSLGDLSLTSSTSSSPSESVYVAVRDAKAKLGPDMSGKPFWGKIILSTPNQDLNLNLLVICNKIYSESGVLDHAGIEAGGTSLLVERIYTVAPKHENLLESLDLESDFDGDSCDIKTLKTMFSGQYELEAETSVSMSRCFVLHISGSV